MNLHRRVASERNPSESSTPLMKRFLIVFLAIAAGAASALWATRNFPTLPFEFGLAHLPKPSVGELKPSPEMPVFGRSTPQQTTNSAELDKLITATLAKMKSEDPAHDFQRATVLRAAITYLYSPCTEYTKRELIESVTEYVDAYRMILGCGQTDRICSLRHMELAWRAFRSDYDHEIRKHIRYAYDRGGFSTADFPASMRQDLEAVAGLRNKHTTLTCGPPEPLPNSLQTP